MTQSEKLDFVLNILSESKNFVSSKELYSETENTIDKDELTPIIGKLFSDNYIEKKIIDKPNNSKLTPPYFCRMTYSGLLFIERGGFTSENKRIKRNSIWTKSKTIANFLNAIIILIIAALGVYVSWESKKKDTIIETNILKIDSLKLEIKSLKTKSDTLNMK